jgi:hypothetical protein
MTISSWFAIRACPRLYKQGNKVALPLSLSCAWTLAGILEFSFILLSVLFFYIADGENTQHW